jgi:hypothetical protein
MAFTPMQFRNQERRRLQPALRRRALVGAFCWALAVASGGSVTLAAGLGAPVTTEYEVKAALLYHFTQFVEWPAAAFPTRDAPLVIGVLGADPFGDVLDKLAEPEQGSGHPIQVVRCRSLEEAGRCHLLFISSSERPNLPQIVASLDHRPVLTVADFDGFLRHGGIVQFRKTPDNKIRLRVDLVQAKAAGLTFSSKLLRVVEIVPPDEE